MRSANPYARRLFTDDLAMLRAGVLDAAEREQAASVLKSAVGLVVLDEGLVRSTPDAWG